MKIKTLASLVAQVIGAVLLACGVWMLAGPGWAALAAGVLLLAFGIAGEVTR